MELERQQKIEAEYKILKDRWIDCLIEIESKAQTLKEIADDLVKIGRFSEGIYDEPYFKNLWKQRAEEDCD